MEESSQSIANCNTKINFMDIQVVVTGDTL
jgi:hypothetical protein